MLVYIQIIGMVLEVQVLAIMIVGVKLVLILMIIIRVQLYIFPKESMSFLWLVVVKRM